jgi:uncharacterized protein (DUF885 family)
MVGGLIVWNWGMSNGALALLLLACSGVTPSLEVPAANEEALADMQTQAAEAQLNTGLDELWELAMRRYPTWATYEGDRRFDDQITDLSPAAREAFVTATEAIAAAVELIEPEHLSPMSRDTRRMVLLSAQDLRARQVCRTENWEVNGLEGPQVDYAMMPIFYSIRDEADLENLARRYAATDEQINQRIANLRTGLAEGYRSVAVNADRAIGQLDDLLATSIEADPMLNISPVDDSIVYDTSGLADVIESTVRPALERYRDFLRDEVLPAARDHVGVSETPNGDDCYAVLMAHHIGPGFDPSALHQIGIEQLEWAHAGMLEVAAEMGIEAETAGQVIEAMRGDSGQYTDSSEELISLNSIVVERATGAMSETFGRTPATPIEVIAMEAHRAEDAPAAYYYSAPEDGSRSAFYYVNTSAPESRPLYNLEALAFHEAIPGHHLQIALAQELPGVHIWRRSAGQTAFVEGWALYSEILADEMGLYSSPSRRFGMYNYQAWRAARLVIDTGIHVMGWTREQALQFLLENTSLPQNEAANEIDRYIAWPGQALAYLVGRLEIQALRREAEAQLGDSFDIREFHDRVLSAGAIPLTILRENIAEWLNPYL